MVHREHTAILDILEIIDGLPPNDPTPTAWIRGGHHLHLLRENAIDDDEIILYAWSRSASIATAVAGRPNMASLDPVDLSEWNYNPYAGRVHYQWNEVEGKASVESSTLLDDDETIRHRRNLVFVRGLEDVPGTTYYELLQEFAHAEDIHWREERHAYCNIDENGDWRSVVSVTEKNSRDIALVTCRRDALERWLVATNNVLVRYFDFMMIPNRQDFESWDRGSWEQVGESDSLFYNRCLHPNGYGWVRGTQLVPARSPEGQLFQAYSDLTGLEHREHVSFLVDDFRNGGVREASAAPGESTNYFDARNNSLPYETSPAFFGSEVLSKYKSDREKYTINEEHRTIDCRGAWYLKRYDVNDAGQIFAFLCDLRRLPYREQLYWKSYNEEPKGPISRRSFENYFLGEWSSYETPLERLSDILNDWGRRRLAWWQISDEKLLHRLYTPITDSRDEWGMAFLELSKIVIEGFQKGPIQVVLLQENIPFENDHGSLTLLERLLSARASEGDGPVRLKGLKEAQLIRTKAHSHSAGSEADKLAKGALKEHGTYRGHFERVCVQIVSELEAIDAAFQTT